MFFCIHALCPSGNNAVALCSRCSGERQGMPAWCTAEGLVIVLQGCGKAFVVDPHSCSHLMVAGVLWLFSYKLINQVQGLTEVPASV